MEICLYTQMRMYFEWKLQNPFFCSKTVILRGGSFNYFADVDLLRESLSMKEVRGPRKLVQAKKKN